MQLRARQQRTVPLHHLLLPLAASVLLQACGGGSSGGSSNSSANGGAPLPSDTPRIEPYERAAARSAPIQPEAQALTAPAGVPAVPVGLGPLPAGTIEAAVQRASVSSAQPRATPIGLSRDLPDTATPVAVAARLRWQPAPAGGQAAALRIVSAGAAAVRVALRVHQLPAGSVLRVWGANGTVNAVTAAEVLATLERNARAGVAGDAARLYWLPSVGGDSATVEIALPPGGDPADVKLALPMLSHQWVDLAGNKVDEQLKIGKAGACQVDAMCSDVGTHEGRAVARMEFVALDTFTGRPTSFLCTGTLLADVRASGTPWFLAANHCVPDQPAASTLATYWFYRSNACGSSTLYSGATRVTGGAVLEWSNVATDTAFMRLINPPPVGALYAGSVVVSPTPGVSVATAHHPDGDLLKFSVGIVSAYAACTGSGDSASCTQQGAEPGTTFLTVRWTSGTTEQGSSGAPLLAPLAGTSRLYVSGQLYAGLASCSSPLQPDYFGRFDIAYRTRLIDFLGAAPGFR